MADTERLRHADTIIRNHALWSVASGAIPVALADLAAVSAVQLDMIRQLCEVFEVDFSATKGKALVTAITSAALARVGAASVVKLVPVAGTLVGSMAGGVLAGASSYALGQAFKTHLSDGGTFLDLDAERLKRVYREQFEKGQEVVKEWQAEGEDAADVAVSRGRFFFDKLRRSSTGAAGDASTAPAAEATEDAEAAEIARTPEPSAPKADLSTRLEELAKLHARGLISDADYEATKARLLESI